MLSLVHTPLINGLVKALTIQFFDIVGNWLALIVDRRPFAPVMLDIVLLVTHPKRSEQQANRTPLRTLKELPILTYINILMLK